MASAQEYAGIAQGAAKFGQWLDEKPERDARRAEAKARAKQSQMALEEAKLTSSQRVTQQKSQYELATEQNLAATRQLQADRLRQTTVEALNTYQDDGDVRHLNRLVSEGKANPVGKKVYGDIASITPLDDTPSTKGMLRAQGIQDVEGLLSSDKRNDFFIMNKTDGTQLVMPVANFQKTVGYNKYVSNERVAKSVKAAADLTKLRSGLSVTTIDEDDQIVEDLSTTYDLPKGQVMASLNKADSNMSAAQRREAALRASYPDASEADILLLADSTSPESRYIGEQRVKGDKRPSLELLTEYRSAGRQDTRPAAQKDLEFAIQAEDTIDDIVESSFEGKSYLDLSQEELNSLPFKTRTNIRREIDKIARVSGYSPSKENLKRLREINTIGFLGDKAVSELTDSDIGLIDNFLAPLKDRLPGLAEGAEGRAAYNTLSNVTRNLLFGATLTQGEATAFTQAFGSLGMSPETAMTYLRTTLESAKSDLEAMSKLDNPYVVKHYTGMTEDQLDEAITKINDRIRGINISSRNPELAEPATQTVEQAEQRPEVTDEELEGFYGL